MNIGERAPEFSLPGIDGKEHSLSEFEEKKVLAVIFTCNHCPYAKAYEARFVQLQEDFKEQGVQLVAINANDENNYPEDSFDKMVDRANERGFNFPYLRDQDQSVASAFDAACTPEVFLFDEHRFLRYHGKVDDSWDDPASVEHNYLKDAIEALLGGKGIEGSEQPAIGCSIKWSK